MTLPKTLVDSMEGALLTIKKQYALSNDRGDDAIDNLIAMLKTHEECIGNRVPDKEALENTNGGNG